MDLNGVLERSTHSGTDVVLEDDATDVGAGDDGWLVCRVCGHRVAPRHGASVLGGQHTHRRMNPAGYAFEFAIFATAPGCSVTGPAVAEHSWFAGYRWRIALCGDCRDHLGWFFTTDDSGVFGLILARLDEG